MKEYICVESPNEVEGGMLVRERELIRCKECKHYTVFPFGPFCIKSLETVETTDYCSKAEPKDTTEEVRKQLKDMEQRREMDRKK